MSRTVNDHADSVSTGSTPRPAWREATAFARLTWFNTVHLCRSPFLLLGLAGSALLSLDRGSISDAPTLEYWYSDTSSFATLVGASMFAVVVFPAMREVRYSGTLVFPLGRTSRMLSLMAASVLVTTVFVGALAMLGYWRLSPPLPGTLSPPAYPTPFLLATTGPLLSITLVAWTRSYLPLVVAMLAVPAYWLYGVSIVESRLQTAMYGMEWAVRATIQPFHVHALSVTDVAAHYLAYAVLVAAVLALLALAARGRRSPRTACLVAVAVLLVGAVGIVAHGRTVHTMETPISDDRVYGARGDPCQAREGITYCPLPGYEPWVDHWHTALGPAMDLLPEEARDRMPVVWQSGSYERGLNVPEERSVPVYGYMESGWSYWRAEMVGSAAHRVLDLPSAYDGYSCRATNQARMVLSAWLATTGEERPPSAERMEVLTMNLYPYRPSAMDMEVARALTELPEERVSRVLEENWERLSSSEGRTAELAELLELGTVETSTAPATTEAWDRLFPGHPYGEVSTTAPGWWNAPACS